jgi:uncharacterized protein
MSSTTITSIAQLEALYGDINPMSLRKEIPRLTLPYQRMIEAAPFCAVATTGPGGLDCSPRGDGPGFVHCQIGAAITAWTRYATSSPIRRLRCCF